MDALSLLARLAVLALAFVGSGSLAGLGRTIAADEPVLIVAAVLAVLVAAATAYGAARARRTSTPYW